MTIHVPLNKQDLSIFGVFEESGEVAQEISKFKRFGNNVNPVDGTYPLDRLAGEVGDLYGALDMLTKYLMLDEVVIAHHRAIKEPRMEHFNQHPYVPCPEHLRPYKVVRVAA